MTERTFRFVRKQQVTYTLELTAGEVADRLDASLAEDGRSRATLDPQYLDDLLNGMAADHFELNALLDELTDPRSCDVNDDELRVEEL